MRSIKDKQNVKRLEESDKLYISPGFNPGLQCVVRFVHVLFKNIQGNPKTFEREQSDLNVRTKSPDNMYTETKCF